MSMKGSDYSCIPLCSGCHTQAPHAYRRIGRDAFARRHAMSFPEIVGRLNEIWWTMVTDEKFRSSAR